MTIGNRRATQALPGPREAGARPPRLSFDAPGTSRERRGLDARAAAADFWSDPDRARTCCAAAGDFWSDPDRAQDVLRRRRRLQDDRDLAKSHGGRRRTSTSSWSGSARGEPVEDDLAAALDALEAEV